MIKLFFENACQIMVFFDFHNFKLYWSFITIKSYDFSFCV